MNDLLLRGISIDWDRVAPDTTPSSAKRCASFAACKAALSPQRQLTLLIEIHRCASRGAQFLIATHSPILLGLPNADILSFDGGKIHYCAYEDTGSYQITEMFINRREQVLGMLLDGE